jgi:hypothetical protein
MAVHAIVRVAVAVMDLLHHVAFELGTQPLFFIRSTGPMLAGAQTAWDREGKRHA